MTVSILPKGSAFVRGAIAIAVAKGDMLQASEYAAHRWGERSPAVSVTRAAVAGGSTAEGNWGSALATEAAASAAEFMTIVRRLSIVGRLAGLRRVPPITPVIAQVGGAEGAWVKEGAPIPLSNMSFERLVMPTLKVAAMCVVSEELLRSSDPSAEATIQADLVRAVVEASDAAFIDPLNAGVAAQQPASVTYGVTPIAASGVMRADIDRLVASFEGDLQSAYFVGAPKLLAQIAGEEFPNVGARGGEILGIPALASSGVPNNADAEYRLALVDPTGIVFTANDGAAEIKVSRQGAIQMRDDPVTGGAPMVSMFQVNAVAIAALLHENWQAVRPGSAALLDGITPVEA